MKRIKVVWLLIATALVMMQSVSAQQSEPTNLAAITQLVEKYERRITILELGSGAVSLALAQNSKAICVALLTTGAVEIAQAVQQLSLHTVTVLAPTFFGKEALKTVGRCEHFDVVIIHENSCSCTINSAVIDAFLDLGEYVFIEATSPGLIDELAKRTIPTVAPSLYLSHKPKPHLALARYTQKKWPTSKKSTYSVKSSFKEKFFNKKGLRKPLPWVDGVNLVTFTMLKGIYPCDEQIRTQIEAMEKTHPTHNDLVLGNIIVQGDRLIPIDMADKRRSAKVSRCVNAAQRAFKKGNTRLKNPFKWIDEYYEYVI